MWHFCKSRIPKMRDKDPIHSHQHRGTPSPSGIREGHLAQESACAGSWAVGIQVPHSFSEVPTPFCTSWTQCMGSTESVPTSNTDVAILGGSWGMNVLLLIRISEKKTGWGQKWKTVRKQNKSPPKIFSPYLLWARGWLLVRSIQVFIPF